MNIFSFLRGRRGGDDKCGRVTRVSKYDKTIFFPKLHEARGGFFLREVLIMIMHSHYSVKYWGLFASYFPLRAGTAEKKSLTSCHPPGFYTPRHDTHYYCLDVFNHE